MKYVEKTAKTVDEAITEALIELETTSDNVEIEIINKGSSGIFSIFNSKPARVRVKKKFNLEEYVVDFLSRIFNTMDLDVLIKTSYNENNALMMIDLIGKNMGVIIGKRGQTLDALQYLTSLAVNKVSDNYVCVKLDTENYRQRRKETLEKLARNLSYKVRKTHKKISLEPMNPFERRIIHSTLQNDSYVDTYSEGEEPYRKVIIRPKKN